MYVTQKFVYVLLMIILIPKPFNSIQHRHTNKTEIHGFPIQETTINLKNLNNIARFKKEINVIVREIQ